MKLLPIVAGCTAIIISGPNAGKTVKVISLCAGNKSNASNEERWWRIESENKDLLSTDGPNKGKFLKVAIGRESKLMRIDGGEQDMGLTDKNIYRDHKRFSTAPPTSINCRCVIMPIKLPKEDE